MLRPIRHAVRAQTPALAALMLAALAIVAPSAFAQHAASGGTAFAAPAPPSQQQSQPQQATIVNGRAVAPPAAPARVRQVIAAANEIVEKPYVYGGGHRAFTSRLARGYDCSGSLSHALHGGDFVSWPLDSKSFMRWGQRGTGAWITVYTSRSHAFAIVAGLRFDTSMHDPDAPGPRTGPRWSSQLRGTAGFRARHPRGY